MREIEDEIMRRRGEALERSAISLTQFYGIEIKSFAAEIARLSLLIAEFQCDVRFIGQMEARALVLPLHATGTIVTGNALRIDWAEVCPPVTAAAEEQDLGGPTGRLNLEGGGEEWETYICGNPPYLGGKKQTADQKRDMALVFGKAINYKNLDYVTAFLWVALRNIGANGAFALVSTSSINQGTHVPGFWKFMQEKGAIIVFAHLPFKWSNNAKNNAGVYCNIVGVSKDRKGDRLLFEGSVRQTATNINAYLAPSDDVIVEKRSSPLSSLSPMITGNAAYDQGHLFLDADERASLVENAPAAESFIRRVSGTEEFTDGKLRWCIWITQDNAKEAEKIPEIRSRIEAVEKYRSGGGEVARSIAHIPYRFRYQNRSQGCQIIVPQRSRIDRANYPVGYEEPEIIYTHLAYAIYDADLIDLAVLSSRLHLQWAAATSGRHGDNLRYSANLAWNTFPVPKLTETDKASLTRCAEDILLAREAHFPATIAELYDPEKMPADLRAAHDRNDETLERIYIGRRFRNDTERLEKLFDLYTKMAAKKEKAS